MYVVDRKPHLLLGNSGACNHPVKWSIFPFISVFEIVSALHFSLFRGELGVNTRGGIDEGMGWEVDSLNLLVF